MLKAAIQISMPSLYQLVDVHDIGSDKLYQQIVKHWTVKNKSEILPSMAAASFISDDYSNMMIKMRVYSGQLEQTPVVVAKSEELECLPNILPTR